MAKEERNRAKKTMESEEYDENVIKLKQAVKHLNNRWKIFKQVFYNGKKAMNIDEGKCYEEFIRG